MATTAVKKKTGSMKAQHVVSRVLIYALLIVVAALMLIPFLWMLSASFKLNKDVFTFPIEWIPSNPRPQNYVDIWTKIPLLTFVKNTQSDRRRGMLDHCRRRPSHGAVLRCYCRADEGLGPDDGH